MVMGKVRKRDELGGNLFLKELIVYGESYREKRGNCWNFF